MEKPPISSKKHFNKFENGKPPYPVWKVNTLKEAVEKPLKSQNPGDSVLLSPGGTSFDAYKDFEDRGEHFRKLVEALA